MAGHLFTVPVTVVTVNVTVNLPACCWMKALTCLLCVVMAELLLTWHMDYP